MTEISLENITINTTLLVKIGIVTVLVLSVIIGIVYLQKLLGLLVKNIFSPQLRNIYDQVIKPEANWLTLLWFLSIADIAVLISAKSPWVKVGEIFLSLAIVWLTIWLAFRWFRRLFDTYLLDAFLQTKSKDQYRVFNPTIYVESPVTI
jgi:cobalamin synthase